MTMTKIEAIAKVLNNSSISENATSVFIQVAKKAFVTAVEIAAVTEMNKNAVYSNIGVLLKKGLIEKSGDGYVTTESGDTILIEAAEMWKAAQPEVEAPKVEKKKGTRKAREITVEMTKISSLSSDCCPTSVSSTSQAVINRQNYEITLNNATRDGYRKFEILNRGIFRIVGYKVSEEIINNFKTLGCEIKQGPANCYIDITANENNIVRLMEEIQAAN
ncbi:MotA-like activator of middle period transcription [Aeromonas phage 25]|uniref:Activator of middle promoters n=1 Tax=Aeromonas phage 25 TaxID=2911441 RepID=Q19CD8_9CAUD|nr:MotA-like activator of middle period transcription [Aeromonas phage 25]ABF72787.1 activator of middle promoters [Aeromonas phage 25]